MKQRIAFTAIMALVTTSIISFALVALNFGFKTGFFGVWLRSWFVSYPLAVAVILFLGPPVQVFTNFLLRKPAMRHRREKHRVDVRRRPSNPSSL